jgi:hypothetical protein
VKPATPTKGKVMYGELGVPEKLIASTWKRSETSKAALAVPAAPAASRRKATAAADVPDDVPDDMRSDDERERVMPAPHAGAVIE